MKDNNLFDAVIEYNRSRYYAFVNYQSFNKNIEYERILKARYNKISRIKKRLIYLLVHYKYVYFCTFTFSDKYINCSDKWKKKIIKDSLLSFSSDVKYILNVDYGKNTEREHYHGIIATNNPTDLKSHLSSFYPCFSWTEKIYTDKKSIVKLSKYINKLSNHCIKSSTRNSRIIYNFKGFDGICPTQYEATNYYIIYSSLLGLE